LALQQRLGNGGAIELHEGTGGAVAVPVDDSSDLRLAGPRRTSQQNGDLQRCDAHDPLEYRSQRMAGAEHVLRLEGPPERQCWIGPIRLRGGKATESAPGANRAGCPGLLGFVRRPLWHDCSRPPIADMMCRPTIGCRVAIS